jgi:MFS family permease
VAGVLAQYLPEPLVLTYLLELFLLGAVFGMVMAIPEDADSISLGSLSIHRPRVPRGRVKDFLLALVAGGLLWSIAGIFLAHVPSYVSGLIHARNLATGGAVVALMMGSGIAGQLLLRDWSVFYLQVIGLGSAIVGLAAVVAAWPLASLPLLFAGAIVCGAGAGIGQLGSISELNEIAPPEERGAVNSFYFALVYLFFSIPAVALGLTAVYTGLYPAVRVFAAIIAALALGCLGWLVLRYRLRRPG